MSLPGTSEAREPMRRLRVFTRRIEEPAQMERRHECGKKGDVLPAVLAMAVAAGPMSFDLWLVLLVALELARIICTFGLCRPWRLGPKHPASPPRAGALGNSISFSAFTPSTARSS